MFFLIVGIILAVAFAVSTASEPRRFLNAVLLPSALVAFFISFAVLTSDNERIQTVLAAIVFGLVPLLMIFVATLFIIDGFVMIKKEGVSIKHLLSLFVGVAIIVGLAVAFGAFKLVTASTLMEAFLWLGAILTAYFAFTFSALVLYSLLYKLMPKNLNCDYIIVNGCALVDGERVSPMLKRRVDKAVEVYKKAGSTAKLVLSGGKGDDEMLSEADAMKNYLIETGFDENAIVLEDKSTTTYENLRNVRDMLDAYGAKHSYIFVTSDYHVFRTGLFARKLGMNAHGVGCKTPAYYWASAFIREYVAVMVMFKWLTIAVFMIWLVFAVISMMPV